MEILCSGETISIHLHKRFKGKTCNVFKTVTAQCLYFCTRKCETFKMKRSIDALNTGISYFYVEFLREIRKLH